MSRLKQLIGEIHHRSLWQVLLIYVGAAWACYELIDTVTDRLGLPVWLPGLAIVLFLLGLPFVVATALVREEPHSPAAPPEAAEAESQEVQVGAAEARREARRRHRFLNWRNAVASFVIAFAVWGVVATGWLLLHEREAGASGAVKSVAVLPFVNLSADPEDEYFSDGITGDIINHLSKIADMKVISRTSAFQYKGTDKGLRDIGGELGVATVVEGEVQRIGNRVRINAQLIDARTDEHLWAEQYNRELTDIFMIQSDVAMQIATALRATLTPSERAGIDDTPTEDLEAYEFFLRGIEFLERSYEESDLRMAAEMFETATQLDSSFALAYARLSTVHSRIYWFHYDRSRARLASAKQAVDRALGLEPELPEAHEALGLYYYYGYLDYDRALQELEAAFSRKPGSSSLLRDMGFVERRRGNLQVARARLENAIELDPRDDHTIYNLAETHGRLLRNYPEAERLYDRVLTLAPDWTRVYGFKAWNYICWEGNTSEARAVLEEAANRGLDSVDDPFVGYTWVLADFFDGAYEAALARLSRGSSLAFSTQFYYLPKSLLAAQIFDLGGNSELARLQYDSAAALLEGMIQETPEDSRLYGSLGMAYAGLGRVEDAIHAGQKGVDLLPMSKEAWRGLFRIEELARILTMAGQQDAAIDQIEFLLSVPGDMSVSRLRLDPIWAPLRDHPRFQAVLTKYE